MLKKLRYIFFIILVLIFGFSLKSFAFSLLPDIEEEIKNNEINISLNLSDLEKYSNGLNVVSGKLTYDHDVFESISFNGSKDWTCAYNNKESSGNEGKFMLITTSGNATKKTEIAQIKLKLKENIKNTNTKIIIQSIESSYDSEKIEAEDETIDLEINDNKVKINKDTKLETKQESNENTAEKATAQKDTKDSNQKNDDYIAYIFIGLIVIVTIMFLIFIIKIIKKKEVIK